MATSGDALSKIRGYHPSGDCALCGQFAERLSLDHIVPLFEGGGHDMGNIQWLCKVCHKAKSDEEHRRWGATIGKSEAHREKILRAMQRPEVRAKLSQASTGRTHSAESRERIGQAHRGVKRSAETRDRQRQSALIVWQTRDADLRQRMAEQLRAQADRQRGRKVGPMSEEQRRKIGEAQRRRWASGTRKAAGQ